jgi:dolichol-phosphate mannosyltransferase
MVVLLLLSGVQMLMLGMTGEYLWRVLDEVRGRPPYIVRETVGGLERSAKAHLPLAERPAPINHGPKMRTGVTRSADSDD